MIPNQKCKWLAVLLALCGGSWGLHSAQADTMIWGNDTQILDHYGNPMIGGVVTLWKDGGDGIINLYGGGDDLLLEISTTFPTNNPGYFYMVFDTATVPGLVNGANVFTRVGDASTLGASLWAVDLGSPPILVPLLDSSAPSPPHFYSTGAATWFPLTPPDPWIELSPATLNFGTQEVGVTASRALELSAWSYGSVTYSGPMTQPPFYQPLSSGTGMAPSIITLNLEFRPLSTGLYQTAVTFSYNGIGIGAPSYKPNPTTLVSCVAIVTDVDGDGVSDVWENQRFGSLTNCANTTNDFDHDGATDADEWIAGTDPTNALSVFQGSMNGGAETNLVLSWPSLGTASYTIKSSPTISGGITGVVALSIVGTPPTNQFILPTPTNASGFFKISIDR